MIDGDIDSALAVTQETIYETKEGTTVPKQIWVSLDTSKPKVTSIDKGAERPDFEYEHEHEHGPEPIDMSSPQQERTRTHRVSWCHDNYFQSLISLHRRKRIIFRSMLTGSMEY